jgi:hypothetical protein
MEQKKLAIIATKRNREAENSSSKVKGMSHRDKSNK